MQYRRMGNPTPLVILTVLLPLLGACDAVWQEGPGGTRGPHGALDMSEQTVLVDSLLPAHDVTQPPPGVDLHIWRQVVIPADNPMKPERVALGKKLYFDTRLSKDGTVACATCHDVTRGFTDQRPVSEGVGGALGKRNAPTTMNAFLMQSLFLDGRAPSLEAQAKLPILNPIEMAQPNEQAAIAAIAEDPTYKQMFSFAFGRLPELRGSGAGHRRLRAYLGVPRCPLRSLPGGRHKGHLGRGRARLGALQRQGALHELSPVEPLESHRYRPPIPQRRGVGAQAEFRGAGASSARNPGAGRGRAGGRPPGPADRSVGSSVGSWSPRTAPTSAPSRPCSCAISP